MSLKQELLTGISKHLQIQNKRALTITVTAVVGEGDYGLKCAVEQLFDKIL